MQIILIIIALLVIVGVPLYISEQRFRRRNPGNETGISEPELKTGTENEGECCGLHLNCEKTSLVATTLEPPVYYEDEELDAYAGRSPESYTEDETEQFRDVLLTLLPEDVAGWARSLHRRGIVMPHDVREELLMIVGEQRQIPD